MAASAIAFATAGINLVQTLLAKPDAHGHSNIPLTREDLRTIVDLQVRGLAARLAERKLTLELSEAAYDLLASEGYDPAFGARPLRRLLQRELENPLAVKLLAGELHDGETVRVDVKDGSLTIDAA